MTEFIEKLIGRLEEKFKYNSEQAEIYRDGSDKDAYFREKKDLYMDRANTYGQVMRIINELAEEYKDKDCSQCSRRKFYQQGYEDARNNNGWIFCKERLPEDENDYIVCFARGYIAISTFTEGSFWDSSDKIEPMAWQPLPVRPRSN